MTTAGLLVAAAAVPVALVARSLRPKGEPFLPRWKPWRVPWVGLTVLGVYFIWLASRFLLVALLTELNFLTAVYPTVSQAPKEGEAGAIVYLWASLFALPLSLGALWVAARWYYPKWKPELAGTGSVAGKVWLAVVAWLAITPVVLIFNGLVNAVSQASGVEPQRHPLEKFGGHPPLDQALFVIQACLVAPLMEELFFRGVLLSWCVGRSKMLESGVSPATAVRPWFVLAAGGMFALSPALEGRSFAPLVFMGLLAAGFALVVRFARTGARRAAAVYATAAFFAIVHSSVWPNPIPLFLLGLALGWLAARTNGILVPVLVHGLFNAVSAVYVLRS